MGDLEFTYRKLLEKPSEKNFSEDFLSRLNCLQQVAGDSQTGHHNAHHAHQLDEDVQRRT